MATDKQEKFARYIWLLFVVMVSFVFTVSYNSYTGFEFYGENTIIKQIANQLFLLPSPLNLICLILGIFFHPIVAFFAWHRRVIGGRLITRIHKFIFNIHKKV
ncbi:hypothetical protein A1L58_18080 [Shewanella baltica]|nr:hypothetical protein A1L58_18080 [Shewanella baltica]